MKSVREYYYQTMFNYTHINHNEILYSQKAYLPVLELETIVREKSRDQLGDIEQAILGFVNDGLHQTNDIGQMLGFPSPTKVTPMLEELRGQGLIVKKKEDYYEITQLGEKSLQLGVAILEVPRAFLICGVTGRLMPKESYKAERLGTEQFKTIPMQAVIIDNAVSIPLKHLDITLLEDKKAYNIPDEVTEIIECESTTAKFLQASLVITKEKKKSIFNLSINDGKIDWLSDSQITSLIEPLGWETKMSEKDILTQIKLRLEALGFINISISIDAIKTILVTFSEASEDALKTLYENEPLIAYIGTNSLQAININRFPFIFEKDERRIDWLKGHVLKLETNQKNISNDAMIYRLGYEIDALYYKSKREKTIPFKTKFKDFMEEKLQNRDASLDNIVQNTLQYAPVYRQKKFTF